MLAKHFEQQVGFGYVDMGKENLKKQEQKTQCTIKPVTFEG